MTETIFDSPPSSVQDDLDDLNNALNSTIPAKATDNILIATWNIRKFGSLTRKWLPTGNYSPKRDLRALRTIIDIISRFDVVAIQEVTGDLRAIRDTQRYLGANWSFMMTDITYGAAGNKERLAKIIGGVAVINIGAATETEMKEKKARMEDALNATRFTVTSMTVSSTL